MSAHLDWSSAPRELLLSVFARLDSPNDLARASGVCRRWHTLTSHDDLWRGFCKDESIEEAEPMRRCDGACRALCRDGQWRLRFLYRLGVEAAWAHDRYRRIGFETSLEARTTSAFRVVDGETMLVVDGSSLYAWRAGSESERIAYVGAENAPLAFDERAGVCVFGAPRHGDDERRRYPIGIARLRRDGNAAKRSWEKTAELSGHENVLIALDISEDVVASSAHDSTVVIWSLSTGQRRRTLSVRQDSLVTLLDSRTLLINRGAFVLQHVELHRLEVDVDVPSWESSLGADLFTGLARHERFCVASARGDTFLLANMRRPRVELFRVSSSRVEHTSVDVPTDDRRCDHVMLPVFVGRRLAIALERCRSVQRPGHDDCRVRMRLIVVDIRSASIVSRRDLLADDDRALLGICVQALRSGDTAALLTVREKAARPSSSSRKSVVRSIHTSGHDPCGRWHCALIRYG